MPVLSYHPALDPYHTAFRSLRVFNLARNPIEYDRLRLLDLYLLFPEFAGDIRLPPSARAWRNKLPHGGKQVLEYMRQDAVIATDDTDS